MCRQNLSSAGGCCVIVYFVYVFSLSYLSVAKISFLRVYQLPVLLVKTKKERRL